MAVNKDPIDIKEAMGKYLDSKTTSKDVQEFIKELGADYDKYKHQNYDYFSVVLAIEEGQPVLNLVGFRKESPEETKKRVAIEEDKQKKVEEAELREYLRLRKKFGKKEE